MKIIQGFIIIARDNNTFSYIIIQIISLSLLQQPRQVQRSVSLCHSADLDWMGGGGWGASSHVASHTVGYTRCSSQLKRCLVSVTLHMVAHRLHNHFLLCTNKGCLPLIPSAPLENPAASSYTILTPLSSLSAYGFDPLCPPGDKRSQ